jgi:hypothetical protein
VRALDALNDDAGTERNALPVGGVRAPLLTLDAHTACRVARLDRLGHGPLLADEPVHADLDRRLVRHAIGEAAEAQQQDGREREEHRPLPADPESRKVHARGTRGAQPERQQEEAGREHLGDDEDGGKPRPYPEPLVHARPFREAALPKVPDGRLAVTHSAAASPGEGP